MKPEEITFLKLARLFPVPLDLAWHENRSSYFSCRKERRKVRLRLHRLFVKAPGPVLEAIVSFAMKGDKKAEIIVRQMAHLYFSKVQISPEPLSEKGRVYDLFEIQSRIRKQHFPGLNVAIGWSSRYRAGSFKCVTFGSYDRYCNQIRINPLLDDAAVPLYFLEFIVYHEMLHAVCPPRIDARGAVYSHTREFRLRERQFPQFAKAMEWEKNSLTFFKKRARHGRA
ncbi:MAG TPA: hypothetical protein VLE95_08245 [Chlamydiales bacterium]|nr:hypothetical protein [Chlamydiales bacterium]